MAGPWENYQTQTPPASGGEGPWAKYGPSAAAQPQKTIPLVDDKGFSTQAAIDQIPGGAETQTGAGDVNNESLGTKAKGVLEAGRGLVQNSIAGTLAGMREGSARNPEAVKAADKIEAKLGYTPSTKTGRDILSKIGDVAQSSGIQALGPMTGVLEEASSAAMASKQALRAATESGIGQVGSVAGKAVKAVLPSLDPETKLLAQKAIENGIPLRADMLSNNRYVKILGEFLDNVPMSGSKKEERVTAFNKWVGKTIGADPKAERITPEVFTKAMDQAGSRIGETYSTRTLPVDSELIDTINKHLAATATETPANTKVIQGWVDALKSVVQNGEIPGEALKKWNSAIGQAARTQQEGALRLALGNLQTDLMTQFQKQLKGNDLKNFKTARRQYANGMTILPLVSKDIGNGISPGSLMGAVTSNSASKRRMAFGRAGDLGEAARVGSRFLKEPPSSGTAERNAAIRMAETAGAVGAGVASPTIAAAGGLGLYGIANLVNRLGPKFAKSLAGKKVMQNLKEHPLPPAQDITDPSFNPRTEFKGRDGKTYQFGMKGLGDGTVTVGESIQPGKKSVAVVKDPSTGELVARADISKTPDGKVRVSKINTTSEYQQKGIASKIYKELNRHTDLTPDTAQTPEGKRLWDKWAKEGLLDKDGNLPKGALQ